MLLCFFSQPHLSTRSWGLGEDGLNGSPVCCSPITKLLDRAERQAQTKWNVRMSKEKTFLECKQQSLAVIPLLPRQGQPPLMPPPPSMDVPFHVSFLFQGISACPEININSILFKHQLNICHSTVHASNPPGDLSYSLGLYTWLIKPSDNCLTSRLFLLAHLNYCQCCARFHGCKTALRSKSFGVTM